MKKKILVLISITLLVMNILVFQIVAQAAGNTDFTSKTNPVDGAITDDGNIRFIVNIDYDSDGDQDFIAYDGSSYNFFDNNGSGDFTKVTPNVTLPLVNASEYLVTDFDNDGDEDIFAAGEYLGVVGGKATYAPPVYYKNIGNGTFTSAENALITAKATVQNNGVRTIINIDYDNDGDQDFIASNGLDPPNRAYDLYRNNGSGAFTKATLNVTLPTKEASEYLIADFDNDGDEDIFAPGSYFKNNGNGTFTSVTNPLITAKAVTDDGSNRFIINIDYDTDGDQDFIAYDGSSYNFYDNNGSGVFTKVAPNVTLPLKNAVEYLVADFDNDGDEDIFAPGAYFEHDGSLQTALTGKATITGTPVFDETLTVSLTNTNNTGTLSYVWVRGTSNIGGATSSTYKLVESDIGQQIKVKISSDVETGIIESAATAAVKKADCAVAKGVTPVLSSKTDNSITLTVVAGYEYTILLDGANVSTGTWQDSNIFTGLSGKTEYDMYQRVKATTTHKASEISDKLDVVTLDTTAPTIDTNTGMTVNGGTTKTITSSILSSSDDIDSAVDITYTITTLPVNGLLKRSDSLIILNGTFTQADIDNGIIEYTHDDSATTSDSFVFRVSDESGNQVTNQTFNITINPINDATLKDLSVNSIAVVGFDPADYEYDITLAHDATTITIGATTNDSGASVSGTGILAFTGDSHTYTVTVTAEDGTTQLDYDLNVTREPNNDATLSDLTFNGSTVVGFASNNDSYNVMVNHNTSTVSIGAITTDSNASVSGIGTFDFTGSTQTYTITVTAEDGTTQKTYSINVTRTPDNDATLSDLTVDLSRVSGFDSNTIVYNVSVDHHATSITLGATSTDPNASIIGTGLFSFVGNSQTYIVTVTAEDGTTNKTYTLNITRAPDDDATLSDLTVDGSLVAGFSPDDTSYDVYVDADATSVTIDATTTDPNATENGIGSFSFTSDSHTYTVIVTAEDGTTQKHYNVNVLRTKNNDATLSNLTFNGNTVTGFNPNDTDYSVSVAHNTTTVSIGATTTDDKATLTGKGMFTFSGQTQTYSVTVTAENGTQQSYCIHVTRRPDNNATLSSLSLNGIVFSGFSPSTTGYSASVDYDTTSIIIGAKPTDPNASVIGAKEYTFIGDSKRCIVTVTAEDGTTSKTYTIDVSRKTNVTPEPSATITPSAIPDSTSIESTPIPTPNITPNITPTPTTSSLNIIIKTKNININKDINKVTVSIDIDKLPGGATVVQGPDGKQWNVDEAVDGILAIEINLSDVDDNGQVEIVLVNDEEVALGSVLLTGVKSSDNSFIIIILCILGIILILLIIILIKRILKQKEEQKSKHPKRRY